MRVPIVQGPLRGAWWIVGSSTHGCWLGSYELALQSRFVELVKPGSVIYDVGAHVGFYTLLAATLAGHEGRVVAFEPVPRNLGFLRAHLMMNQITNVIVEPVAVADCNAAGRFDDSAGPSEGRLDPSGGISVDCVTLDSLVTRGEIPAPGMIKIDAEGAEMMVLRGGEATIRAHRPALIVATHGSELHAACRAWLQDLGLHVADIDDGSGRPASGLLAVSTD